MMVFYLLRFVECFFVGLVLLELKAMKKQMCRGGVSFI